jgi:hypothetical protein
MIEVLDLRWEIAKFSERGLAPYWSILGAQFRYRTVTSFGFHISYLPDINSFSNSDIPFTMSELAQKESVVFITPLLKRLWPPSPTDPVTADEIANAISHIFTNSLTPVQTGALLTALHFTGLDTKAEVLSKCSQAMRNASAKIDKKAIRDIIKKRGRKEGSYRGGLVR